MHLQKTVIYTPNKHVVRDVVQVTPVLEPWSCRTKKKTSQMNENTRDFRSPSLLLGCAQPVNRNLVICVGDDCVQYLPDMICCAFAFYLRRQRGLLFTKRYVSEKRNIKLLCIDYYISPQDTRLEIQSEAINQSRDEYVSSSQQCANSGPTTQAQF